MDSKKRKSIRFNPITTTSLIVKFDDKSLKCGIENISYTGILLKLFDNKIQYDKLANKKVRVYFSKNEQEPIPFAATIIRDNQKLNQIALKLDDNLSQQQITHIRGDQEKAYDIAIIDKKSVLKEASGIKTCSSNYFIWTIGSMIPLIGGIWTLFIQDKITPSSCSGAMIGVFLLFCMSIFSSLEKTRAIYKRESFVAALDAYLTNGVAPPNYKGWINLKYAYAECASKREAEFCPRKVEKECKFIGEERAKINKYKRIIPSILDSFIALTSTFYSILYVVIVTLSAISLTIVLSNEAYNISRDLIVFLFVTGFLVGLFILGRKANLLLAIVFGTIAIFTIDLAKPNIHLTISTYTIENIFLLIIVFNISYVFGSIGHLIISQLIRLRIKEYSLESQFHMWLTVFENCVFMPHCPNLLTKKEKKVNLISDFLINNIFFRKRKQ